MALTPHRYETLVKQLENYASQYPKRFKRRVFLLALQGYGFILFVLSFLLGIVLYVVTMPESRLRSQAIWLGCLLVIALILLGLLLTALWVRIPKPKGKVIKRKQMPQLYGLVDELAVDLATPKFNKIILTDDLNAAVSQRPVLGIFGWFQNYLLVGLPLMQALDLEQFKAILAHELGHVSGKHSHFVSWIYRIEQTWHQVLERLYQHRNHSHSGTGIWFMDILMLTANGLGFIVFGWFFEWFVPRFSAYSFVLSRQYEYEADRCAAQFIGGEKLAEGLISLEVKTRYLNRMFWRDINQQVNCTPNPPEAISLMSDALKAEIPKEPQQRWLNAALSTTTGIEDTHPCLTERLSALGYLQESAQLSQSLAISRSAAEDLLSPNVLTEIIQQRNEQWKNDKSGVWQGRYQFHQDISEKLANLEDQANLRSLSFDEKWNRCKWTAEIKGPEAGILLLRELLVEKSYFAPANLLLGRLLLERQDESGIDYIESAVSCDIDLTIKGYQLILEYAYYEQGNTQRIKQCQEEIDQYYLRSYDFLKGLYS